MSRHFGPCLCGDTACPSCGPAQGATWPCEYCGAEEECPDPKACQKADDAVAKAMAEAEEEANP